MTAILSALPHLLQTLKLPSVSVYPLPQFFSYNIVQDIKQQLIIDVRGLAFHSRIAIPALPHDIVVGSGMPRSGTEYRTTLGILKFATEIKDSAVSTLNTIFPAYDSLLALVQSRTLA